MKKESWRNGSSNFTILASLYFFPLSPASPPLCVISPASHSFFGRDPKKPPHTHFTDLLMSSFIFLKPMKKAKALFKTNFFSLCINIFFTFDLHTCLGRAAGLGTEEYFNVVYKCTKREIDKTFLI
jgi:hypothetical protein